MDATQRRTDRIVSFATIVGVILTAPATYASLNVYTRPDIITIDIDAPKLKGIVTVYDVINPSDKQLPPPIDSIEWFERNINPFANSKNTFTNKRTYMDEEYSCMAKNIYFEARNESVKGQLAVALVTLARVNDARYPNNVCEVIYDNKQFSWYWDGLSDHPKNTHAFNKAILIASAIMDANIALQDFTYNSTHYHATYVRPYWAEYMVYKTTIETHIFYREEPSVLTASL